MVRARLHPEFRYIHEPLPAGDTAIPVLGHEPLVTTLRERLMYSHGGAYLITGFRGVGKSTLALRALAGTATGRVQARFADLPETGATRENVLGHGERGGWPPAPPR